MWTIKNRARYDRSRLRYPSDLSDDEWKLVAIPSRFSWTMWCSKKPRPAHGQYLKPSDTVSAFDCLRTSGESGEENHAATRLAR